jgi:periplasmic protein TonB
VTPPTAAPAATPATVAAADQQPQADATPVYAPEVVVDARFVHQVQPDYPDVAKEQNVQGTAVVFATVGPKGNVLSTHIDESTGNKLLDQAAMTAARQSSFEPPQINGKPATETYRLIYTFAL